MIYSKIGEGRGGRGGVVVVGLQHPALSTPPPPPSSPNCRIYIAR